ncbi:hypothetical protein GCM10007916_32400 [Psychromonas marina]|uniref:Uncharacterized protein n=1 Tax=Psychromonas marina TaxID=88364 RepID=A0ABQ6E4D9_9GAMM|nr:hypothetical protein [Psychromonas marina]GLS92170.1 hypothetical protein GCM10007916_32400 [Psychromonas marina]
MKFQQTLISLFVIGTLSACGSSSSSDTVVADEESTTTLSGKAADGYLINAKVCLDLNKNKSCDDDEPSAMSDDDGAFSLEGVTQEQIDASPLLVEIIKNQTIDKDNPGVLLTKSYQLSAPAGYTFVSPLTTLVQNEVENGNSVEDAESNVQAKLGTSLNLNDDYVAGKEGGDDSKEFEKLHQIAQVTANIIADNIELLQTAADSEGIALSELISLISNEVFSALANITMQIENIANDEDLEFDADDIAGDINEEHIGLEVEGLTEKIAQNKADKESIVANLVNLIKDGGINWFWSEDEDGYILLEYGNLSLDAAGEINDVEYEIDENGEAVMLSYGSDDDEFVLTKDGWEINNDTITDITLNDNGSITFVMVTTALNETITGKEIVLDGLNVSAILEDTGGDGLWSEAISETLVFPEGSKAYKLDFGATTARSPYELELGDWCQYGNEYDVAQWSALNETCNGIDLNDSWATTLAEFLEEDSSVTIAGGDGYDITIQLIAGGSVEFYKHTIDESEPIQLSSGTWEDITVHTKVLRKVNIPTSVSSLDTDWSLLDDDDGNTFYLTVYEDFVRIVSADNDFGDDGELTFNTTAKEYILDNASRDMLSGEETEEEPEEEITGGTGDISQG